MLSTQHHPEIEHKPLDGGGDRGDHQAGAAEGDDRQGRSTTWSIRPAASSSADRRATAASPAARSSSTPTAARRRTAAARSPARIRRRSTARPPTPRATSRRTSSPSGLATKAQVQVSYAIGVAKPTSIMVTTFGTGKVSDEKLEELVAKHFDLRPKGIIQMLDLLRPIYAEDRGLRPLRPQRAGVHLGKDRQGRRARGRCRRQARRERLS